jgi:hypothetical protein
MSSPSSSLVLTDDIKGLVNNALAEGSPLLLAAVNADGKPVLSLRGSVQTRGADQLGLWVRNAHGGTLDAIRANPDVVLFYRSAKAPVLQFHGRARPAHDAAERSDVYDASPEKERAADAERKGEAVIVELDRVEGVLKLGEAREPVRLAR